MYPVDQTQRDISQISLQNDAQRDPAPVLSIIKKFCACLETEDITYCHWKSNNALERSASGDNDLDLLVSRADVPKFTEILSQFRFKQAKSPSGKEMPGVLDYFAFDKESDKIIHCHAHYQLILGHDLSKNYRIPIEKQYLDSAVQGELFKVPLAEYEYILFVIRMVLKHFPWDVMLNRQGKLKLNELEELSYLKNMIDHDRVKEILKNDLPYLNSELFNKCTQALEKDSSIWFRLNTGRQLQTKLKANAHNTQMIDAYFKLWHRFAFAYRRRLVKSSLKYRLMSGGAMIAIVGGDGAGKSTVVDSLYSWLTKNFKTTFTHLGKPKWSWTTTFVRGVLKIGQLLGLYGVESPFRETIDQKSLISPGYPWLLREVCRGRDRYRKYLKARRFAARGGLVIVDRFPIPQIQLMDGPQTEKFIEQINNGKGAGHFFCPRPNSRITKILVNIEKSYYNQIMAPEFLAVLRLDPNIAVQRRPDEDESFVRGRNTEIWELNWENVDAHVIDASKPKDDVLAEIKNLTWNSL